MYYKKNGFKPSILSILIQKDQLLQVHGQCKIVLENDKSTTGPCPKYIRPLADVLCIIIAGFWDYLFEFMWK